MTMEEQLKTCPFCGSEAEIVRNGSGGYFVRCTNKQCAAKTRLYHENETGARMFWNKRSRSADKTCHPIFGECSECHYPLSDFASYCSHCGARIEVKR